MIEIKDIEKLAALSRIKLNDAEKTQMQKEIGDILTYIDQIQKVSGGDSGDRAAVGRKKELVRNVMRSDSAPHESGTATDAILANAPAKQAGYFKVKKIL